MLVKKAIFYLNALFLTFSAIAQENNIGIGEWRIHLPYNPISSIEVTNNATFAAGPINAFSVNHSDKSATILSTINSLNDIEISEMKYHKGLNLLIIGYTNGNIDIIKENVTTNINDIKRKNIIGSKKINHVFFQGNLAYLSCDFGVSVLDLVKLEIKETYNNLAAGGLSNIIYGCTFSSDGDSIFLATQNGLMTAKNSPAINLMDFANWYTYGAANKISTTGIRGVCTLNNKIYAAILNDSISYLNGSEWIKTPMFMNDVKSINTCQGKLLACTVDIVLIASSETSFYYIQNSNIKAPTDAVIDDNGFIWIGDYYKGLFCNNGSSVTFTQYQPNGPATINAYSLKYFDGKIIACAGGHTNAYTYLNRTGEYYIFDNEWSTTNYSITGFPPVLDIINAAYSPIENKIYLASFGFGVVVDNRNNTYALINDVPPFVKSFAGSGPNIIIADVEVDKDGNLWVANALGQLNTNSLHKKTLDGTWTSKSFGTIGQFPEEILIDKNNYKWIRLDPNKDGGLIVYTDKTNTYKYLTNQAGQGGLPDKGVKAIAEDKNGQIWVGTKEGIAIFYTPDNILSSSPSDASSPIFDGFPLLYNEDITCIEVDGGNRKWIGTKNGLWLFNDDASEVLTYFTIENSPLLSNTIIDLEINEKTGELFISTDKGIISYRGTATTGTTKPSNVKVFPNPVKPDFAGLVGISGLTNDAVVKITDIYGNLIYETKAEGGTAVWNGKNYNGAKAKTGVYLIFSSSEDGTETYVAKMAVVE